MSEVSQTVGSSPISALRHRDFRLLWTGLVVSSAGSWMQQFGLGWLVVELAARQGTPNLSPLYLGLMGLARAIPAFGFGLFAGVVADRVDHRRLLIVSQAAGGVVAALFAALTLSDRVTIPLVLAGTALAAAANAFDIPTRQALVSSLVPRRELMSAIGLASGAFTAGVLVGPLIGGLLIAPLGVGGLMLINALSYLVIIGALVAMRTAPRVIAAERMGLIASLREGLQFVWHEPVVRWVVLLAALTTLLGRSVYGLLPAVARDPLHVGAVELSWLLAASGAASLCGSFAVASLGGFRRRGLVLVGSTISIGLLLIVFSLQRELLPAVLALAPLSFSAMVFMGMMNAIDQTQPPEHLRGRVMAVQVVTVQTGIPLGSMLVGSIATLTGIEVALAVSGTLVVLGGLSVLVRVPAMRLYDSGAERVP